ncbi:MAG: serine hydrolase domain-containing protein [Cyanobacteria bacterium J06635_15]
MNSQFFLKKLSLIFGVFIWVTVFLFSGVVESVEAATRSPASVCNTTTLAVKQFFPDPKVDTEYFINQVQTLIGHAPEVKGLTVALANPNGDIIATLEKGYARTACDADGEQYFTVDTIHQWGSVSKLITTAAVLKALEASLLSVDAPLRTLLPQRWHLLINNTNEDRQKNVTLGQLLSHRAGFFDEGCGSYHVGERMALGDYLPCKGTSVPPAVGTRSYSNGLGVAGDFALTPIVAPNYADDLEKELAGASKSEYDATSRYSRAILYRNYVRNTLFAPLSIDGACNLSEYFGGNNNYALPYTSASDPSGGSVGNYDQGGCAAGGWALSTRDMLKFLGKLRNANTLLARKSYALMEKTSSDRLGWGYNSAWQVYDHGGKISSHNYSYVVALKNGYVAAMAQNSRRTSGADRTEAIVESFNKAYGKKMVPIIEAILD